MRRMEVRTFAFGLNYLTWVQPHLHAKVDSKWGSFLGGNAR